MSGKNLCSSQRESAPHLFLCLPPFFGQYYLGRRHARTCHCAAVMQKIMFPVGTKLHRSKHEHVLTSVSFHLSYLFNLPLCVLTICFSFFCSSLRKGKACHSLTDYVITVKFMLFCNLETSYSMAHLIKLLRQTSLLTDFCGSVWPA